ncbi:MAG: hypothetical protein QXL54_02455 [Candidatus Bathyarchaeia archaeon]
MILIFSFIGTLVNNYVMIFLPILMKPTYIMGTFSMILYAYSFLLNFVLFFAAFYYWCGKIIQEEPASTIISLILGGFAGTWAGGLAATMLLIELAPETFTFIVGLSRLPSAMQQNLTSNVVLAVAAMLSSWFVLKWDEKLAETGVQAEAQPPIDIALVSVLYLVYGILSLCILPLVGIVLSITDMEWSLPLFAALTPLILVNTGAQIAIAMGLYRGKRWGWLLAFTATLAGICTQINLVIAYFKYLWLFALAVIALALNIMTAVLLLTTSSRQYCRIINPTKTSQQA